MTTFRTKAASFRYEAHKPKLELEDRVTELMAEYGYKAIARQVSGVNNETVIDFEKTVKVIPRPE